MNTKETEAVEELIYYEKHEFHLTHAQNDQRVIATNLNSIDKPRNTDPITYKSRRVSWSFPFSSSNIKLLDRHFLIDFGRYVTRWWVKWNFDF